MTEAVVTNRAQSPRQHLAQIAPDKLNAGERESFVAVAGVPILPAEGNGVVGDLEEAPIADGGAGHVSAEVFEGAGAVAGRLNVHTPILAPDTGVHLPLVLFK